MIENHEKSVVIKRKLRNNFTMVSNDILQSKQLSLKAKGLMCYLLSLPDDTQIKKTQLHQELKDGRDAVVSAFNELIDARYITVEKNVDDVLKQFSYFYTIYDIPQLMDKEEPLLESRNGFPVTENPSSIYSNKDNTNNKRKRNSEKDNEILLKHKKDWYRDQYYKAKLSGYENIALYSIFVSYIFGSNPLKKPATGILSLNEQVTWEEFEKLLNKVSGVNKIDPILSKLDDMINTPKYLKGKASLYLTLNKWLNNEQQR